jgi:hypothetical protein
MFLPAPWNFEKGLIFKWVQTAGLFKPLNEGALA